MDAGCRETHARRRRTTGALAKAAWARPASTSPRLRAPAALAALCLALSLASCLARTLASCLPACWAVSTYVRHKDDCLAPCGGQTNGIGHRGIRVGTRAVRGADRRVAVCCVAWWWQMLDQAKVPGERPAEADRHVQRRVAKFFGLACANGTAKGCVNLGVMQVWCRGEGDLAAHRSSVHRMWRGVGGVRKHVMPCGKARNGDAAQPCV